MRMMVIGDVEVGVQRRRRRRGAVLTGKREDAADLDLTGGRTPIVVLGGIMEQIIETGLLQNLDFILLHTAVCILS